MSIKNISPASLARSFLTWLRERDVTNFEMLLGLVSLLITCIGAGLVCFYVGIRFVCQETVYDYISESHCVIHNVERAMSDDSVIR